MITFAYFGAGSDAIQVARATLTDETGRRVPCFVNTPANDDHLPNGVFLIPEEPLRPGTTYTAEVRAETARGRDISRHWSFTTGR